MLDLVNTATDWIGFVVTVLIILFFALLLLGTPLLLVFIKCLHAVHDYRTRNAPPQHPRLDPPQPCPACGREAFRITGVSLWTGLDAHGKRAHGVECYGRCTACGRWLEQADDRWADMAQDQRAFFDRRREEQSAVLSEFFPAPVRDAVLLLDDRDARFIAFREALPPEMQIVWWRSARQMIGDLPDYLRFARLICLDHDLYPADGEPDPGDGLDAVRALAELRPVCPVIVHSSNGDRAAVMADELRIAGWTCRSVAPFGTAWVHRDWLLAVRELVPACEAPPPSAGYTPAPAPGRVVRRPPC